MEKISKEYNAFAKVVSNDSPYPIIDYFSSNDVKKIFHEEYEKIIYQHSKINDKYFSDKGKGKINLLFLDHYLILCFRFASALYKSQKFDSQLLDAIYYSSKVRTSADLFYNASVGDYFIPIHPIGTIMTSQSKYGKYLQVYGSVLIGPLEQPWPYGPRKASETPKPEIGNGVIIYNHAKILGSSKIGNNVTIGVGCIIQNKDIPDNTLVIKDPNSDRLLLLKNRRNNQQIFND